VCLTKNVVNIAFKNFLVKKMAKITIPFLGLKIEKSLALIGMIFVGVLLWTPVIAPFLNDMLGTEFTVVGPDLEDEQLGEDTAKWTFYVKDILDSSQTVTGSIALYSPSEPGVIIETLTLSSGSIATTSDYPEGKQFFVLYYSATFTWLRHGEVLTMPDIPSYDSIQTKEGGTIYVYKRADSSAATDIQGLKNGDKIWDNATVSLGGTTAGGFNVTADRSDSDPPQMGIRLTNEDDNTAYVDPRGFYDYSVTPSTASLYAQKAAFLMITFERTGAVANVTDVREYVQFENEAGMTIFQQSAKFVYVLVPLDSELLAGVREVSSGVVLQSGQLVTIFTETFDWPASMSTDLYTDDIDIEIALVSAYSSAALSTKVSQSDMEIVGELGDSPATYGGKAWTNDWSIGDI